MKNFSDLSISKFLALSALILVLPGLIYYFYKGFHLENEPQKVSFEIDFSEFLTQLNERWQLGDIEEDWIKNKISCSDIPNLENKKTEFLACNAAYMKCWLSGKISDFDGIIRTSNHKFKANINSLKTIGHGDLKIDFVETNTRKEFSVRLERNCNQTYLPQKIYSSGPESDSSNIWDNYGRHIFIDKYYVTNWDIKQWKKQGIKI